MQGEWEAFDEAYDYGGDGGCLYVREGEDEQGNKVAFAAGTRWIDGGFDGYHDWLAGIARFAIGEEHWSGMQVENIYDAAPLFRDFDEDDIYKEIGWFATLEEAEEAIEDEIEPYLQ